MPPAGKPPFWSAEREWSPVIFNCASTGRGVRETVETVGDGSKSSFRLRCAVDEVYSTEACLPHATLVTWTNLGNLFNRHRSEARAPNRLTLGCPSSSTLITMTSASGA